MNKAIVAIAILSFLTLLSSCSSHGDSNEGFKKTESESISTITTPPIISTEISTTILTPVAEKTLTTVEEKDKHVKKMVIFPFSDGLGFNPILNGIPLFGLQLYRFSGISDSEIDEWSSGFNFDVYSEKDLSMQTDLSNFPNLYSFICDFNIPEQQIRDKLILSNEEILSGEYPIDWAYIYSDEQIAALATRSKADVTCLLATYHTMVKHDKYYAPGWFFHASLENYRNAGMAANDLLSRLSGYRQIEYFGGRAGVTQYFFDVIERKIYDYLDEDVDIVELCGYERDFDMPMAYDGYYMNEENTWVNDEYRDNYFAFFDALYEDEETDYYNLIKNNIVYSPHWVYYNKSAAYREAGITPADLAEMLPRYKELGIMSDEAVAALEKKINSYTNSKE